MTRRRRPRARRSERGSPAPATTAATWRQSVPLDAVAPIVLAAALAVAFVAVTLPVLATVPYDFDEAWLMLDARLVARGLRPYVDFAHHEMPLHLYLLALCGKVFGPTPFGYRMLSVLCIAGSGLVLFALARPFVGPIPALVAQALFLFSPLQGRALAALPETSALAFSLLGAWLLFAGGRRWTTSASAVAFVVALLIKPTCLVMPASAALGLAWARDWRRLRDFALAGVGASALGLAWVMVVSDGVFMDALVFELTRLGTHEGGIWSVDSGFADMRRLGGIETRWQWAVATFKSYYQVRADVVPITIFVGSLLALPIWLARCVRSQPALQVFLVLWPASYLLLDFVLVDFVSPRYFIPFPAFSAFLFAGWVWLAERRVPRPAVAGAAAIACVALAIQFAGTLRSDRDLWYWGRSDWIAHAYPRVVSFNPMLFAATGTEPGCDFANPVLTFGGFGETVLRTERTRRFRFTEDRLIDCLKAHPEMPMVVDWAFYFFTRPGSRLREYLAAEGSAQRLYFSPEAMEQWNRPLLRLNPYR